MMCALCWKKRGLKTMLNNFYILSLIAFLGCGVYLVTKRVPQSSDATRSQTIRVYIPVFLIQILFVLFDQFCEILLSYKNQDKNLEFSSNIKLDVTVFNPLLAASTPSWPVDSDLHWFLNLQQLQKPLMGIKISNNRFVNSDMLRYSM